VEPITGPNNDPRPRQARVQAPYTMNGSKPMIGFVMSVSKDPKYATPPQNPRKALGMVKVISHFRLPRRIARYSGQVNRFCAVSERVELNRG